MNLKDLAFLTDRFNAFLLSQPENKIIYHDKNKGIVKGIQLKPEINNIATAEVIPSSTSYNSKKK